MKRKKKKASKATQMPKKPISVGVLLDGKIIYRMDVAQKETGINPFTLYPATHDSVQGLS